MAEFSDKTVANRRFAGKFKYAGLGWKRAAPPKEAPVFNPEDDSDDDDTKKKKKKKQKKKAKHRDRHADRFAAEEAERAWVEEQERLAREELERIAREEEEERLRLEAEEAERIRLEEEEKERIRLEEEERIRLEEEEKERIRLEEEEKERLRLEEEENERLRLEEEERARIEEQQRKEEEERLRLEEEERQKREEEESKLTGAADTEGFDEATDADVSHMSDTFGDSAFTESPPESEPAADEIEDLRREVEEEEAQRAAEKEQIRLERVEAGQDDYVSEDGSSMQHVIALQNALKEKEAKKAMTKKKRGKALTETSNLGSLTSDQILALQKQLKKAEAKRAADKRRRRLEREKAGLDPSDTESGSSMDEILALRNALMDAEARRETDRKGVTDSETTYLQTMSSEELGTLQSEKKKAGKRKRGLDTTESGMSDPQTASSGQPGTLQSEVDEAMSSRAAAKERRRLERTEKGLGSSDTESGSSLGEITDLQEKLRDAEKSKALGLKAVTSEHILDLRRHLGLSQAKRAADKKSRRLERTKAGLDPSDTDSGSSLEEIEALREKLKDAVAQREMGLTAVTSEHILDLRRQLEAAQAKRTADKKRRKMERIEAGLDPSDTESDFSRGETEALHEKLKDAELRRQMGLTRSGAPGLDAAALEYIRDLQRKIEEAKTRRAADKERKRLERIEAGLDASDTESGSSLDEIRDLQEKLKDAEEAWRNMGKREKSKKKVRISSTVVSQSESESSREAEKQRAKMAAHKQTERASDSEDSSTDDEEEKLKRRRWRPDRFDHKIGDGIPGVWCLIPHQGDICGPIAKEMIPELLLSTRNDDCHLLAQGLPDVDCCRRGRRMPTHVNCNIL